MATNEAERGRVNADQVEDLIEAAIESATRIAAESATTEATARATESEVSAERRREDNMENVIAVEEQAAQGDVMFTRVDAIPENAEEVPRSEELVVARSGAGHHHVIANAPPVAVLFQTGNPLVSYLRVDGDHADVVHMRSWDTHAPLRLTKGNWEIRRQREWVPEGWRRVED